MEEEIKELLEIVVKRYIEEYIINLDLSDSTKNMLKKQLRKTFLDEDLLYDLGTIAHKNSVPKSLVKGKIEELKQKAISYGTFIDKDESFNIQSKISVLQDLLERSREDEILSRR